MAQPAKVGWEHYVGGDSHVFRFTVTTPKGEVFEMGRAEPVAGNDGVPIDDLVVTAYNAIKAGVEAEVDKKDSSGTGGTLALGPDGAATASLPLAEPAPATPTATA